MWPFLKEFCSVGITDWTEHTNALSHDDADVIYSGAVKHHSMHWLNLNLYQYVHTVSGIGLHYECPQHLLCVMCHHVTGWLLMQSVKSHSSKPLFKCFLVLNQPLDILLNMGQGLTSSCLTSSCFWVVLEEGFHLLETNDNTACILLGFRSDKKWDTKHVLLERPFLDTSEIFISITNVEKKSSL